MQIGCLVACDTKGRSFYINAVRTVDEKNMAPPTPHNNQSRRKIQATPPCTHGVYEYMLLIMGYIMQKNNQSLSIGKI